MANLTKIVDSWKRMKIAGASIFAVSCLLHPCIADNEKSPSLSFFSDINGGINYESRLINKVKNVPLEIRDVPYSSDEEESSHWIVQPIEDDEVGFYGRISLLSGRVGAKLSSVEDKVNLKLGLGLDWNFDASATMNNYAEREDVGERDPYNGTYHYNNTPRLGCETTTTTATPNRSVDYYYLHPVFGPDGNTCLRPSIFSEIEFKINDEKKLAFGYKVFKEKIVAESGWYRGGNTNERWQEYDLADLTVGMPYASLRFNDSKDDENIFASIDAGFLNATTKKFTEMGERMDFEFNNSPWFLGINIGRRF